MTIDNYYPIINGQQSPEQPAPDNVYRWGTIVALDPFSVILDGDANPLASRPESLVADLYPGARVWCQIYRRRVVIIGKARSIGSGGVWATYSIHGTGMSAGVTYRDTNTQVLEDSAGPSFATLRYPTNASRLTIDTAGWYSLSGRFALAFYEGSGIRQYVEYRVWKDAEAPSSAYIIRASFSNGETDIANGSAYVHFDEGNEISIGTYSSGWDYNLDKNWNLYTIRLIEAT